MASNVFENGNVVIRSSSVTFPTWIAALMPPELHKPRLKYFKYKLGNLCVPVIR